MMLDLINAVCREVAQAFPGVTIYLTNRKEGITRPAFSIYMSLTTRSDLSRRVYNDNTSVRIKYHAPLDESQNIDGRQQLADFDKLRALFEKGFVTVNDRTAKIKWLEGGTINQEVYLTINLDLTGSIQDTTSYDLMQEVNLRRE